MECRTGRGVDDSDSDRDGAEGGTERSEPLADGLRRGGQTPLHGRSEGLEERQEELRVALVEPGVEADADDILVPLKPVLDEVQDRRLAFAPLAVQADDEARWVGAVGDGIGDPVGEGLPSEAVVRWVRDRSVGEVADRGRRRSALVSSAVSCHHRLHHYERVFVILPQRGWGLGPSFAGRRR